MRVLLDRQPPISRPASLIYLVADLDAEQFLRRDIDPNLVRLCDPVPVKVEIPVLLNDLGIVFTLGLDLDDPGILIVLVLDGRPELANDHRIWRDKEVPLASTDPTFVQREMDQLGLALHVLDVDGTGAVGNVQILCTNRTHHDLVHNRVKVGLAEVRSVDRDAQQHRRLVLLVGLVLYEQRPLQKLPDPFRPSGSIRPLLSDRDCRHGHPRREERLVCSGLEAVAGLC